MKITANSRFELARNFFSAGCQLRPTILKDVTRSNSISCVAKMNKVVSIALNQLRFISFKRMRELRLLSSQWGEFPLAYFSRIILAIKITKVDLPYFHC